MPWPKGRSRPKQAGRKAGTPNKITTDFKLAVTRLVESADLDELLADVPKERRLEALARIAEYAFPKLGRTELTGKEGDGPVVIQIVKYTGDAT